MLVVVPVIALNAGGKNPTEFHWFDRIAIGFSAPVQTGIKWSIETVWDGMESYLLLLNTQANNKDLALENRKLLNELAAFQEVALENGRLQKMVEFNSPLEGKKILAQVIAQDVSPEFRMIRLNKGAHHGVQMGMAVVSLEGVVGRVIRTGKDFCDVLSLLDSSSAIDALLQRNRVRGVIEGQGGSTLSMKYLRRTDDVQEGDLVVSSGIGGLFPKGLTIGKVVSVKKKNFGISQTVEVAPAVDFNRLEEVTIIDPPKMPLDQATLEPPKAAEIVEKTEKEKSEKGDKTKTEKPKTEKPKTEKPKVEKPKAEKVEPPKEENKGNNPKQ